MLTDRRSTGCRSLAAFALIFCYSPLLTGHDLYLLPDKFRPAAGETIHVAFHNGDSFPESEVAPKPERLRNAVLRSALRSVPISHLQISGKETLGTATVVETGSLFLSVETVPNFIELPAEKFTDYLREEGLTGVIAWRESHGESTQPGRERYQKFAKSLLVSGAGNDFFQKPQGLTIEIVLLKDPSAMRAGAQLPVQVLLRGKPARDLSVEAAWAGDGGRKKVSVVGRTDADGRVVVPLTNPGKWRLHALFMERCNDAKAADWESYWASLTFELR